MHKVTEEDINLINELYQKYGVMAEVARKTGFSANTIKRHLNEKSLKLRENEQEDFDALWFYIYRLFGQYSEESPLSGHNITLIHKFRKQGMPYRGQLLTLKYYYEVRHNPVKPQYKTIGLIPYIYADAEKYYQSQAQKADELAAEIKKQLQKDRIEIKYNPQNYKTVRRNKRKKPIDLSQLESEI